MDLFIDTHLSDVTIILYENGKIVKFKKIESVMQNSKIIMPLIKKMLNRDIPNSIIIVNGPGSFTGVRLGVTIAKTLAYTLNIKIRSVTSLECMAVSVKDGEKICSFNDNNGYYVGFFKTDNSIYKDYIYVKNNEYQIFRQNNFVYEDVVLDYNKIIEFALNKEAVNPHNINPLYIKKLDYEL